MKANLIPNDTARCGNETCQKRMVCNRYLQLQIDKQLDEDKLIYVSAFTPTDCTFFIEHDDQN